MDRTRLAGVLALTAAWTLFAGQDTTIRVDVQQVLVPVVVTDKKGHHVTGLHAADFRILEDGVPQSIAFFSNEFAGTADDLSALAKSTTGGQAAKGGPRHTFVICIDALHTTPASAARMRDALQKLFEKEKTSGAQYVLIAIGRQLQVLQAATTNPLAVLLKLRSAAFQNSMGGLDASAFSAQLQNIRTHMDEFCKRCACGGRPSRGNCDSEIDTLKQSVDSEAERWVAPVKGLLEQFKSVVEELAKLPTGRTLVLVSDGFNLNPKREFYAAVASYLPNNAQFKLDDSGDASEGLRPVLQVATERNVVIDAIDSRGGTASLGNSGSMDASASGGNSGTSSILGTNRSAASRSGPIQSMPDTQAVSLKAETSPTMEQLAQATGGAYFHSGGDMLKELNSVLADGREYYVLAYAPKNGAHDGKFRSITVETADKNLSIRAKPGYWAAQ